MEPKVVLANLLEGIPDLLISSVDYPSVNNIL